jgi:dTDP-4-dehydrorhamnose 3,5-epimerase-like enzyme
LNASEYNKAVADGNWPNDPTVPKEPAFVDERGEITNLALLDIGAVSEIETHRGDIRANHYHREDWHFAYVVRGAVAYFQRDIGDSTIPAPRMYIPGEVFFTPPMKEHAMLFLDESVIITWSKRRRDHESHEADVVRVEFITPDVAAKYL